MKKNMILQMAKGIVLGYLVSGICLVVVAFLMFQWDISEGVVRGCIIFAYVFSCFLSGMVVSARHEGRKYLWGLAMGLLYYVILFAVSMVFNRAVFTQIPGIFPAFFLCCFGGMLGGMMQAGKR